MQLLLKIIEAPTLRERILNALNEQRIIASKAWDNVPKNKEFLRCLHQKSKNEQLMLHRSFLMSALIEIKKYCRNGAEIDPEKIDLQIREVKSGTIDEIIFRWWDLVWWNLPYQRAVGRQLRFLIWDKYHDAPFGLIYLKSPVLKIKDRDKFLGVSRENLDLIINMSMDAKRVGALPPYNDLIGGKMVALALSCNEIREIYREKYKDYITKKINRKIKSDLLFITTTSAFGKSSIYNRLKFKNEIVAHRVGFTKGTGTFHIPESIYKELLEFLDGQGVDIRRGFEHKSGSAKLKLVSLGLRLLGLPNLEKHGIKREIFVFPLVRNLREVIQNNQEPIWYDRPFNDLVAFWKERWAIPRAKRLPKWKEFNCENFLNDIKRTLKELNERTKI